MAPLPDASLNTQRDYVPYRKGIYINPTLIEHSETAEGHFVLFRDLEGNLYVGGTFSGLGSLNATKQSIQTLHSDWKFVGADFFVTGGVGNLAFQGGLIGYESIDDKIITRLNSPEDIN